MKNRGKAAAILLGVLVVFVFAGFAVAILSMRPAKLSQQKMQKKAEAWNDIKTAEITKGSEDDSQGEEYEKELESFEAAGAADKAARKEDKEDKEDTKEKEADTEYLCSYSSERILTEEDITSLNAGTYQGLPNGKGIIQMVINEIYARHGYQFETPEVQQYFEQKKWYQDIRARNADMSCLKRNVSD